MTTTPGAKKGSVAHAGSSAEPQAPASGGGATILEREASARKSRAGVPAELRKYKEERNAEWVQNTSEKVCGLLWPALSPLLAHPSPAVRSAVARGVCPARWHAGVRVVRLVGCVPVEGGRQKEAYVVVA